jgi:hypothetical protein
LNSLVSRAHGSAAPPSLLSNGFHAEKEAHSALFPIGRFTFTAPRHLYFLPLQSFPANDWAATPAARAIIRAGKAPRSLGFVSQVCDLVHFPNPSCAACHNGFVNGFVKAIPRF